MGIRTVSVYKKLVENPKLAALDYREEYGVYQLVSLDKNIKPDTLGRKVMEYAQKGDRRLYSVNELGRKTEYKYNEMGQLVELVSNGEKETVYKYDNKGRVAETEDILGRTYQNIYGEDNRLAKLIQPDGTQSDFDYDRFGHLIKREGAGAYPLSYNYTSFGEIASYRDAQGAETKFLYDKHGRMTSRIWPDGSATVYKYGKNGQLEVKEEAGRITGYVYDDMNRLVKVQTVLGNEAIETLVNYDKYGYIIKISDGKTSIEYAYDKYGRLIVEDGPVGIIRYVYNAEGLLFAKSCEFKENPGQFLTKYYYDEFSRVNKVESQAGVYTYSYDRKGRIASLAMGDKAEVAYTYDKANRLTSKTLNGETLCSYEYDKLNRRVKAEVNGIKWDYGYDIYNQLISAKADDGKTYDYSYDKIGNRLKFNDVALAYNKLNQININGYQYDRWGNLIRTPNASYKYNLNNRLVEVKKNDITVKYSYDPLGQRIETVENVKGQEKTTKYLMSGMVEQARLSGGITQYHTLGLDIAQSLNRTGAVGAVLATTSNNVSFNYLYDGNGNVIAVSNNNGDISEKLNYSPFGELISGKSNIPFTFSTKAVDVSGLSYYGYRFYSADLGRWMSRDPIKENGGINIYGIENNNFIDYIDYLGLKLTVEKAGDDYFHFFHVIASDGSQKILRSFKGGTSNLIYRNEDKVSPVFETNIHNCPCVKDGTGVWNAKISWWGTLAGFPPVNSGEMVDWEGIVTFPQASANTVNWHETTEVGLLQQLYNVTVAKAESRASEYACSKNKLYKKSKEELSGYIRWDTAVDTFLAQFRSGSPFDDKFGYFMDSNGTFQLKTPQSSYNASDFDQWYKPDIWE